jgi:hypothetical protein
VLSKNIKIKVYRIIVLPVVLYGCETWSLTLRKECRLRMLRAREQRSGEKYIMRGLIVCIPHQILFG